MYKKADGILAAFSADGRPEFDPTIFGSAQIDITKEELNDIRKARQVKIENGQLSLTPRIEEPAHEVLERIKNKTASKEDLNDLLSYIVSEKL